MCRGTDIDKALHLKTIDNLRMLLESGTMQLMTPLEN